MKRLFSFIRHLIVLRSVSLAKWVMDYESFKPDYTYKK